MKTLGDRIRELRGQKDLSLREFAKKIGHLSAAFLSDVELGRRYPSESVLEEMARALGTTLEDLKSHDNRAPVQELRKMASMDPALGMALRKVANRQVTAADIMKLAEQNRKRSHRGSAG